MRQKPGAAAGHQATQLPTQCRGSTFTTASAWTLQGPSISLKSTSGLKRAASATRSWLLSLVRKGLLEDDHVVDDTLLLRPGCSQSTRHPTAPTRLIGVLYEHEFSPLALVPSDVRAQDLSLMAAPPSSGKRTAICRARDSKLACMMV